MAPSPTRYQYTFFRRRLVRTFSAMALALSASFIAACGVRGPPRPPLSANASESAPGQQSSDTSKTGAAATGAPASGGVDISQGGIEGAEACEACELHEAPTIQ